MVAANEAIEKIKAIGDVTYSEISKVKIDTARTAYNELTNSGRKGIDTGRTGLYSGYSDDVAELPEYLN